MVAQPQLIQLKFRPMTHGQLPFHDQICRPPPKAIEFLDPPTQTAPRPLTHETNMDPMDLDLPDVQV